MKLCKKCKKKVANKAKICRYCGSDVSKSKIILKTNANSDSIKKSSATITKKNENLKKDDAVEAKNIKKQSINKKNIERVPKNELQSISKPIVNTSKVQEVTTKKDVTNKKERKKKKESKFSKLPLNVKTLIIVNASIIVCFLGISFGIELYKKMTNYENIVRIDDRGLYVFNMGDTITYNDVNYTISKVETSEGTLKRKPKEGYQYLIVTIEIKNNSDVQIEYGAENWTMTNSLEEETSRLFIPSLNIDTGLYSGKLVVGGKKKGTLIFEEPIGDKNLMLNYYKTDNENSEEKQNDASKENDDITNVFSEEINDNNNEVVEDIPIEKSKPIFSVKICVD